MSTPDEAASLFVYGSLLDEAHRDEIIGRRVETLAATLHDYERARGKHYFICPRTGSSTDGLLLLDLNERDFATLDEYEEIPTLYTREKIIVAIDGSASVRCWVYLPTPATLTMAR